MGVADHTEEAGSALVLKKFSRISFVKKCKCESDLLHLCYREDAFPVIADSFPGDRSVDP